MTADMGYGQKQNRGESGQSGGRKAKGKGRKVNKKCVEKKRCEVAYGVFFLFFSSKKQATQLSEIIHMMITMFSHTHISKRFSHISQVLGRCVNCLLPLLIDPSSKQFMCSSSVFTFPGCPYLFSVAIIMTEPPIICGV